MGGLRPGADCIILTRAVEAGCKRFFPSPTAGACALNRLLLAFRAFWMCLTNRDVAERVANALKPDEIGPDLRILNLLQRDGRLIDFLEEEIDGYGDAQIGAAVRDIHRGCAKVLREYLSIKPIHTATEGASVVVDAGFNPAAIRLTGNVAGSPPFRGVLKHHGWKVESVRLPDTLPRAGADPVLSPAEIEIP